MERELLEAAALMRAGAKPRAVRAGLASKLGDSDASGFWELWDFAERVGAPLAETLEQQAEIERAQRIANSRLAALFVAPKATFQLVAVLPFIALMSAQLGGLNPLGAFAQSWIPWLSIAVGALLLVTAHLLTSGLLKRSKPIPLAVNQCLRLFLIAAGAGHSSVRCHELVERQIGTNALRLEQLSGLRDLLARIDQFGAAPNTLAKSEISLDLERLEHEQSVRVERASVRLIAPAALLSMPSFALIALVPTALGLATTINR
jgi:hypothetical protein